LTEEIFVRVYEDRMDLVRAVIVGPFGTPYQDGLFFFDFHLPPEYPDVPPVRKMFKYEEYIFHCSPHKCISCPFVFFVWASNDAVSVLSFRWLAY
jgi:ubiquitin-protein ligase